MIARRRRVGERIVQARGRRGARGGRARWSSTSPPSRMVPSPKVKEQSATSTATCARRQALRGIGAVAHERAGEHRGADVVRQRVGREGAHRDEQPGDVAHAEMQERDAVVPGERRIGDERRERGEEISVRRDRGEARPRPSPREMSAQLAVEEPSRDDDRQRARSTGHTNSRDVLHRRGDRSRRPPFCA